MSIMKVVYKLERIGDSEKYNIRRFINGELDIIIEHKPFNSEIEAKQFCRLLMRGTNEIFPRKKKWAK